jgi:acyl dehydratase
LSDDQFPEYRVKARNTSLTGENPIHHEDVARLHGFPGALVPGVNVYAYVTEPLVARFGAAWLERGTAALRLLRPVLDGEELTVSGEIRSRDASGLTASAQASTASAAGCAVVDLTLPAGLPTPVNLARYDTAPLPAERPPATRAHLETLEVLGTPSIPYDADCAAEYLERIHDPLPIYRGPGAYVHPGFFLVQANRALDRNVRVGPWIHVASTVRHLGTARVGETLTTRGRVRSLYSRKQREYVELDLMIVTGEPPRPVAHILHTAIYQLPPPR